jgi:hypothetical protein
MATRILLATTVRWVATARLAASFVRTGCEVDVVCPRGHPVTKTLAASRIHRYHAFAPLRSLLAAVRVAAPDLVVPCDDLATAHLHELHRRLAHAAAAGVRALIERSLGAPSGFPVARARARLIALAHQVGVRAPLTAVARTEVELRDWLRTNGYPAVLKTDGSYGGKGVRVVRTVTEALHGWRELSSPPSPPRAIKRAVVNHDLNYLPRCLARVRPVVNVQHHIRGQEANATVACWHGTVLASVVARVLHTLDEYGPASVVEVIDDPDISAAVGKVVGLVGLSGLAGFDFVIDEDTGHPYLIEMNPRATQICHLPLGAGRDLPASLRAALSGERLREAPRVTDRDLIAFFPQEWLRDPASPFLKTAYHDVPWDQPDLVRVCVRDRLVDKAWSWISSLAIPGGAQNNGRAPRPTTIEKEGSGAPRGAARLPNVSTSWTGKTPWPRSLRLPTGDKTLNSDAPGRSTRSA